MLTRSVAPPTNSFEDSIRVSFFPIFLLLHLLSRLHIRRSNHMNIIWDCSMEWINRASNDCQLKYIYWWQLANIVVVNVFPSLFYSSNSCVRGFVPYTFVWCILTGIVETAKSKKKKSNQNIIYQTNTKRLKNGILYFVCLFSFGSFGFISICTLFICCRRFRRHYYNSFSSKLLLFRSDVVWQRQRKEKPLIC